MTAVKARGVTSVVHLCLFLEENPAVLQSVWHKWNSVVHCFHSILAKDTLNADYCLLFLGEWLNASLRGVGVSFEKSCFQCDKSWPHKADVVLDVFIEHVHNSAQQINFPYILSLAGTGQHVLQILNSVISSYFFLSPKLKYKVPICLWLRIFTVVLPLQNVKRVTLYKSYVLKGKLLRGVMFEVFILVKIWSVVFWVISHSLGWHYKSTCHHNWWDYHPDIKDMTRAMHVILFTFHPQWNFAAHEVFCLKSTQLNVIENAVGCMEMGKL